MVDDVPLELRIVYPRHPASPMRPVAVVSHADEMNAFERKGLRGMERVMKGNEEEMSAKE
jgi:hypothetical protein